MTDSHRQGVPSSPETQPERVRDELDQMDITHDGARRRPTDKPLEETMGAVETEVTPVAPPMTGPGDLVGDEDPSAPNINPRDEIPGG